MELHVSDDNRNFFEFFLNETLNKKLDEFEAKILKLILLNKALISDRTIHGRFVLKPLLEYKSIPAQDLKTKINKMLQSLEINLRALINDTIKNNNLLSKPDSPKLAEDWKNIIKTLPQVISVVGEKILNNIEKAWSEEDIIRTANKYHLNLDAYSIVGTLSSSNIIEILLKKADNYSRDHMGLIRFSNLINLYKNCFESQIAFKNNFTEDEKKLEISNFNTAILQVLNIFKLEQKPEQQPKPLHLNRVTP